MTCRRNHADQEQHGPLCGIWGLPGGDDQGGGQKGADQAGVKGGDHGRGAACDAAGHGKITGKRRPCPQRHQSAGVQFGKAGTDDDQRADEAHADGGPTAGANLFAQHKGRDGGKDQGLDEEDGQRIGDGQVFQRREEQEGGGDQQHGAQAVIPGPIRPDGGGAAVAQHERQGQKRAEGHARPDDLHHRHALLT